MSPSRTSPPTVAADVQSIVQRALEQTVNGVVVTDALLPGNPIVHVNEGFTRLTGYSADEVLGRNCAFLQGKDRNQLGIGKLRVAIAMGEEVMVVLRNYRRNGTRFWNRVEMSPVRDETGRVTHFFALQTDVTLEREREEASMMRSMELERTITAHPLGLVTLDSERTVHLFSPACADLLRIDADRALGLSLDELRQTVADIGGTSPESLAWPSRPETVLWELHSPTHRVIEVAVSEIGELTGEQMALMRDVTQERVQQATRDHFLSTAAHELRTPLGSIRGFTELMLLRGYDAEQAKPMLETVLKQSIRLGALLDDLLDLAHLDEKGAHAFSLKAVNLSQVMRAAAEVIELPGSLHTLEVQAPDEPVMVQGHADRLEQVLINLLSNAVKYSPQGGRVTCRVARADPGWCACSVSDEGMGLTEEDQGRLFTRFFRANPSGPIPGTGLGLAIVKEMVERMGGRIVVDSRLGHGTTFTVYLQEASALSGAEPHRVPS